jgi:hypothetical protein
MRSDLVKGFLTTTLMTTLGAGLVAGVFIARPAIAQDNMPEGPGKAETVAACSGCHGLGQITGEHRSAEDWATTVTAMINNGAPVADADFDKVVNYLATNFGTGAAPAAGATPAAPGAAPATPGVAPAAPAESGATPAAPGMAPAESGAAPATPGVTPATPGVTPAPGAVPAAPAAPAGSAAATPSDGMPEGPGKAETVAACSGCHGVGQIIGEHRSAEDWATTVTAMINNGAPVADADFDKVVNYLATNFGTGAAPAAPAPAQ